MSQLTIMNRAGLTGFEMGLERLLEIGRAYPNMRWRDLDAIGRGQLPPAMNGWLTDLGKAVAAPVRWVGGVATDAVNYIADKTGDAVRLATDQKVLDSVSRAVAAYTTGGGSEALRGLLNNVGSMTPEQQQQTAQALNISRAELLAIAGAGEGAAKEKWVPWVLGGVAILGVVSLGAWVVNKKG